MASVKEVLKSAGGSVAEKLLIPPHLLDIIPGYNARLPGPAMEAHIEWLMGQIETKGFDQNQPLEVSRNGDRFNVRHGHCRVTAVFRLIEKGVPFQTVPALLEPQGTNDVDRGYRIGTQNGQLVLSDLDYGVLVKRQRGFGESDKQIIAGFGKNAAWLSRIMDLAGAAPEVHRAVAAKEISSTEAVRLVREDSATAGARIEAAREVTRADGRTKIRPRDVREVVEKEKPRTEPPSLLSLAVAVVLARETGDMAELDAAIDVMERQIGVAMVDAARERIAA